MADKFHLFSQKGYSGLIPCNDCGKAEWNYPDTLSELPDRYLDYHRKLQLEEDTKGVLTTGKMNNRSGSFLKRRKDMLGYRESDNQCRTGPESFFRIPLP